MDPQQEKNSSDLSPENTGTTERGLDISWEQEFLTKEPKLLKKTHMDPLGSDPVVVDTLQGF